MKLDLYLNRQRITLEQLIEALHIEDYEHLLKHCSSIGIQCLTEEETQYVFKKNVEERATNPSNSKKKRLSNKKSQKSKSNDSVSAGGSKSTQRLRKSSTKRRGKRDSDKVESVQSPGGSESPK